MAASSIHVLHVDDDESITELAELMLEREDGVQVTTRTAPEDVLEVFDPAEFDCVVSDYDMPTLNGLELYEELVEQFPHPDFPYILYTGRGSEDVASKALNAGLTGYLQKGGNEQWDRLQNRIREGVERYRATHRAQRYDTVLKALGYPIYVVDETGRFRWVNDELAAMLGRDREEIIGESTSYIKPPETVARAEDELGRLLSSEGPDTTRFPATLVAADGEEIEFRDHMAVLPYEGEEFEGSVGILRPLDEDLLP